ncbi:hypothetical protein AgCh_024720 [Apium graveolens]
MGKKAELVPEREDTNPQGYTVERNDEDDGEKEDLLNASFHHENSSSRQKDSSAPHKNLFSRFGSYNYPIMNSHLQPPSMYARRMVPPMIWYSSYAKQRQMPRPMLNGFTGYPTDD